MFKNTIAKLTLTPISPKIEPRSSVLPHDTTRYQEALALAKNLRDAGKTKIEIARAIYPLIAPESKEVVHLALMEGCLLTEKGAVTYRYNLIREAKKKPRHHLE